MESIVQELVRAINGFFSVYPFIISSFYSFILYAKTLKSTFMVWIIY